VKALISGGLDRLRFSPQPIIRKPVQPANLYTPDKDPWRWCAAICAAFIALLWWRLHIPSKIYFDEVHYVKAARILLTMERPQNPEHPMVGKEILAAGMWLFGDTAQGWRTMPALFGTFGLFAFSRMVWQASHRRLATILATILLATDFAWYVQSRIAMLDIFMAVFCVVAMWQIAAAVRVPGQARWRLALAGLCLGLSLGAKWSVALPAMVPGLAFLAIRLSQHRGRFLIATEGAPIPGISLIEAGLWLGLLPVLTYFATFLPTFFYAHNPVNWHHLIDYQQYMIRLQDSVVKKHTYMSVWWQWVLDERPIWYLYEAVDGAQRGVLLMGNPASMWAGLVALVWCLWAGVKRGRKDALAFAALYLAAIGMWISNGKPVQFYYHYLLPGTFLMACLALALDDLWRRQNRWRWLAQGTLATVLALFAFFFPIISAAELAGKQSFNRWMWLSSWR
jgi:dolichyl-phosphate-mannose--protein O-mannosyl transferase